MMGSAGDRISTCDHYSDSHLAIAMAEAKPASAQLCGFKQQKEDMRLQ